MVLDPSTAARDLAPRAAPFTARCTFYEDGSIVDPGVVAVTVTREDGTAVTSGNASGTGVAVRTFALTAAHTATVDVLTLTWVSSAKGTIITQVEVVGGFLFSIPELDASLNKGGSSANYSLDGMLAARVAATDAFEQEAGVSFTTRYRRDTVDGSGTTDLFLPTPRPTSVRAGSVAGTALTAGEVAELEVEEATGIVYWESGWTSGRRNIQLTWEHGYRTPPADVSRAVMLIASHLLADGPFDDRGYAVSDDAGAIRLLTAGVSGAAFSIPEVQAALQRYRYVRVA